ncbi:hypothetical protein [Actimicrobium antarcticum]|uniref:Transmembrane protein n=1 Tax=Actimicrobium antarcticum TaxID=1051899 RepID=A0ABP7T663_9BURK
MQHSALLLLAILLSACTPSHDWRQVRGTDAPYTVVLPAKPATLTRQIDLDGTPVSMTMTAAEVNAVTYAVGSLELADAAKANLALTAMKTALIKNINGTVLHEKVTVNPTGTTIDVEASGTPKGGQPRLLVARFASKNQRAYQAIVTGPEKAVSRENIDTFMTSFKLE